ncbi:acetolactate synthase small subunit [Cyclobacteriaceae bacterium]|jgi:acetolactate synthase-1/3 small subunit|nr:acetolactate synthase small subunit [Cyclobacteriaceae bacterium]MDA8889828.1 acetolactate synthase small subunit [Cyclobacteriaceae bacterium]
MSLELKYPTSTPREFTLSVLTEDKSGLINQLTIIFTKRKININSLNVSVTEVKGVSRFTIVIETSKDMIDNIVKQIRKLIDVLGAFVYEEDQIFYQEIALYKVPKYAIVDGKSIEDLVSKSGARILVIETDYMIIEKTGKAKETHDLYQKLEPFGLLEFIRSGRVAISKSTRKTEAYIKELEASNSNKLSIKDF